MPLFSSNSSARPAPARPAPFPYTDIGHRQLRLLTFAPESTAQNIELRIQVVDRDARPRYTALSYMWGEPSPLHRITLNGRPFDVQPNLHRALRYLRSSLRGSFWIDAVCINQQNTVERTHQVRAMSETFGKADMVASWIGPCDAVIRSVFQLSLAQSTNARLSRSEEQSIRRAASELTEKRYWTRMWIQQEVLLQRNVVLFCGEYQQPLYPLIKWLADRRLCEFHWSTGLARVMDYQGTEVKPTLLKLTVSFSHCECRDPRDRIFALISLVDDDERAALLQHLPDYKLNLGQVLLIVLQHVRVVNGQKRLARQLDSITHHLVGTGDSPCGQATRGKYWALDDAFKEGRGSTMAVSREERDMLASKFVLYGETSWLDVFRCIFGPTQSQRTDVWVLDPPLSRAQQDRLLAQWAYPDL